MEQFKYIQPLDQMERISRTELGEKLDEILDKVDKNNVGFVITDNTIISVSGFTRQLTITRYGKTMMTAENGA